MNQPEFDEAHAKMMADSQADILAFCEDVIGAPSRIEAKAIAEKMVRLWAAGASWAAKYPELARRVINVKDYPR